MSDLVFKRQHSKATLGIFWNPFMGEPVNPPTWSKPKGLCMCPFQGKDGGDTF